MIMDTLKVEIGKRVVKLISDYSRWELIIILMIIGVIFFALGYVVHWFLKSKQIKSDTKKLISEAEKNAIETAEKRINLIEKSQSYRSKFVSNSNLIALSLRTLIDSLRCNDIDRFDTQREESLNIFYVEFIQSFINYMEIATSYLSKGEMNSFIQNEIFPFIDTLGNFLETVNLQPVLQKLKRSKAMLKKSTLNYITTRTEKSISFLSVKMKNNYKIKMERISSFLE